MGGIKKRRATNRKRNKGQITLKTTAMLVKGGANAGNIGYTSEHSNAGIIRLKIKRKT